MDLRITPVNKDHEQNGTWTEYRGVDLLIARSNNTLFAKTMRQLSKPFAKQLKKGDLAPETVNSILAKATAVGILKDWRNFKIGGEDVPYSTENATNLLINDPDLMDFVSDFSSELDNYLTEQDDSEVKE